MNSWARQVVELNIRHYHNLLNGDLDPAKRKVVLQLLAEEEARLAGLDKGESAYAPSPNKSQGCQ
jgi:hypothetical protein